MKNSKMEKYLATKGNKASYVEYTELNCKIVEIGVIYGF